MLSFFLGLFGVILSFVGWFGFKSFTMLLVGSLFYIIETIMEWKSLNIGAKFVDLIIFIIGSIVALIVKTPFYIGGMIAINIYSGIMVLFSLPMIVEQLKFILKK